MRISACLALLLLSAGCAAGRVEKKMTTSETTPEWKGPMGGSSANHNHLVVDDAAGWSSVWAELGKPAPALDFTKYCAVAVFVGERPTGGYGVAYESPVAKGDDLVVRYRITKPTGFSTQAFTRSWSVKAFPRPKGRVIVEYLPK